MTDKPENTGIDSANPAERDRIDLNHEMAGLDNGRIKRFLSESAISYSGETKKEKSRREFQTLLDMLLAEDAIYAALYYEVVEKIEKAQQAVDLALIDINQRLEVYGRTLQILRENAAELPDGTKVFRSNNGSIFTEHGKRLSDDKARDIVFSDHAPNWETYMGVNCRYSNKSAMPFADEINISWADYPFLFVI